MSAFHGPFTRQVSGCRATRARSRWTRCAIRCCSAVHSVLAPSCARYQLDIGHLLQPAARAPRSSGCTATSRCGATSPGPRPSSSANVIAFVDFTRDNGATRASCPCSRGWPDREMLPSEQMAAAAAARADRLRGNAGGSAVVYTGGTIHAGTNITDIPRRRAPELTAGLGAPRRTTISRHRPRSRRRCRERPRSCSVKQEN